MKTTPASFITSLGLLISPVSAVEPAPGNAAAIRGAIHLAQLTTQPWLAEWKGAALEKIRLVEPKKDQAWPTGLPPVWRAKIVNAKGDTGYLAWDAGGEGMILAGAMPAELARAIQADADEHRVPLQVSLNRFRFETLQTEIGADRPVLLSCIVRLPHKPQLSWGHEVVGVGWMKIGDVRFVGIADNFYPVKNPATIRWIRTDAFQSLIALRPKSK